MAKVRGVNKFDAEKMDEAYELNDTDLQLSLATALIEEALIDLENISSMLTNGHIESSLSILSCTQRALGEFFIDAQLEVIYN